ncbi:MAG: hypothetical protein ACOY4D_04810 [Pseudomonadota bacterium]
MKFDKLKLACAIALAGVSAQAAALTAFETPDVTVYLTGATAPDAFLATIATGMFEAGSIRYQDNNGTTANFTDDGRLFNAYFGVMKSTSDIPSTLRGKKVMFIKRSKGGSVWGVNPVARAEKVATLQISSAACVLNSGVYRCPEVGVDPGLGAPTGQEMVPDFGVSDVAPNMFKGDFNVEFGSTELGGSEVGKLSSFPVNTLMMGLAVTDAIPTTTYLSRAAYGSMLSNAVTDWSQVDAGLSPAAGTQVVVCRRVPGSGTQTSYNWFFNNFPCTKGAVSGDAFTTPARMADSAGYNDGDANGYPDTGSGTQADPYVIDAAAGYTVLENSTSGNVRDCLNKAGKGGIHTFKDEQGKWFKVDFGTGGYGAIGVLSLDSFGKENGWSYRNMDGAGWYNTSTNTVTGSGIAPTQANLIEAKYDFAAELTMQYRNATVAGVPALSGLKKAFADLFIKRAGDPAFQSIATAALPPAYTPAPGLAVAKATRFGNMCSPLQKLF